MPQDDRKKTFNAAKSAVNAYAKDPSDKNAERVQGAWGAVKDRQAVPIWHSILKIGYDPIPAQRKISSTSFKKR